MVGYSVLHLHATCNNNVPVEEEPMDTIYDDCKWQNDTGDFPATDNVVSSHIISNFTDQLYKHVLDEGHEVIVSGERK
jgi:hypothetical protein